MFNSGNGLKDLIAISANDNVREQGEEEHSQESLLQPILMTSLSSASNLPVPVRPAAASASTFANIGKSRSHFDKPLNTSAAATAAAASSASSRGRRGHGGCARSRIGKRNDEPFLVKLYEEPQRLFMARSEADIFNGTFTGIAHCDFEARICLTILSTFKFWTF